MLSDLHLQNIPGGFSHFIKAGSFPVSQFIEPLFNGMSNELVMLLSEIFWWLHITGYFDFYELSVFFKTLTYIISISKYLFCESKSSGSV